jgi:hypothetical protein
MRLALHARLCHRGLLQDDSSVQRADLCQLLLRLLRKGFLMCTHYSYVQILYLLALGSVQGLHHTLHLRRLWMRLAAIRWNQEDQHAHNHLSDDPHITCHMAGHLVQHDWGGAIECNKTLLWKEPHVQRQPESAAGMPAPSCQKGAS